MDQPVTNASIEMASKSSISSDSVGPQPTVPEPSALEPSASVPSATVSPAFEPPATESSVIQPSSTEFAPSEPIVTVDDVQPVFERTGNNVVDKTPDSAYGTKSSGSHSNIQFSFTNDDAMSTTNSTNTSSLMASPKSPRYIQRNPVTGSGIDDPRPRSRQSSRRGNQCN